MSGDESLLADLTDFLPLGVWIARAPGGEYVFSNRVFREIMGMEARADVVAGGYAEPYGICSRAGTPLAEEHMPFARALAARATITVDDIVIHRTDGHKVNIRATARPVFDGENITHVVIAFADITAEVAAGEARKSGEERLRVLQRLEALGTLAAGVAHDFNNLLSSIRLLASLLSQSEVDASRREDLEHIQAAAVSASHLARSLLTFGQHGPARAVPVDAVRVVRGVVELVRRSFDKKIDIVFTADEASARLQADPAQLEQVVMNLLVNARDAMPSGGRVSVRVAHVVLSEAQPPLLPGPHVVIEVADTGPGVPHELRARLFEPYFTTKQRGEERGSGLGLATVYGVVQAHGGYVEVLDAEPHGALFRVTLPVIDGPATTVPVRAGSEPPVCGRGHVLVVDDEPGVRSAIARALQELGYTVREAADGVAALEVARAEHAELDLVLLDTVMPTMGGRETFVALRKLAPDLPVLMTTGRSSPQDLAELLAMGIAGVLPKPFDLTSLSRALDAVLGGR